MHTTKWPKEKSIPSGWKRGLTRSFSHKGWIWITNGVDSKRISSNDEIPIGWRRGQIQNQGKGITTTITNGSENKKVLKTDPIPAGWWRGMTFKKGPLANRNCQSKDELI